MILLLRHGETAWNVEGRIQGRSESDLTQRGERQAAAMARLAVELAVREAGVWKLICSPLRRARRTAEPIAAALGVRTEIDDRLVEVSFGDWEGRRRAEVGVSSPFKSFDSPGGETFQDVITRVDSFLADLPPEPERRVIAVSHGVTGRLLRGAYAGLTREAALDQDVPQDAVYRLMGGQIDRFDCEPID